MYYQVGLYRYNWAKDECTQVQIIIVKKGIFSINEIFTNTPLKVIESKEKEWFLFQSDCSFVYKRELNNSNLATLDGVKEYMDKFNIEEFNENIKDNFDVKEKQQKDIAKYLKKYRKGM